MGLFTSIAAVTLSLVAAGSNIAAQSKAAKQQARRAKDAAAEEKRAAALQKRRADVIAARNRRKAAGEARAATGRAVNRAANSGAGGAIGAQGSTIPGVTANLQSQLNFNNAFINNVTTLNEGIRTAFGKARDIRSQPITAGAGLSAFGQLAGAAGKAFGAASSISKFNQPGGPSAATVAAHRSQDQAFAGSGFAI
jgi:hypothetical protein